MRGGRQLTVGVDVGATAVHMVVVSRQTNQSDIKASVTCPLPEGTIEDGCLQDIGVFVAVLQGLRRQCKVPVYTSVRLSIYGLPNALKILKTPKALSEPLSQWVVQDMESCMDVYGGETVIDYCPVGDSSQPVSQVLGVGYDETALCQYLEAFARASLRVDWVSPAYLGYVYGLYERHMAPCPRPRQLLLILRDFEIQLGVFLAGVLDVIRIRPIHEVLDTERHLAACLLQEVHGLIQQYEGEGPSEGDGWQILMVADQHPTLPVVVLWNLRKTLPDAHVVVIDDQATSSLLPGDPQVSCEPLSSLAFGMTLQRETAWADLPHINLLPPTLVKIKQIKRQGLLSSVVAVVVLAVMMALAPIVSVHADKIRNEIRQAGLGQDGQTMSHMIDQCFALEERSKSLKAKQLQLRQVQWDREPLNWSQCLDEVRQALPDHLWFTQLKGWQDKKILVIEGRSMTWNATNRYVSSLAESSVITHAEVINWEFAPNGEVVFRICCWLNRQDVE